MFLRSLSLCGLVSVVLCSPHDITESHLDDLIEGLRSDSLRNEVRGNDADADERDDVMMRTIPRQISPFLQHEPYNETLARKALNFAYLSYCSADCIDSSSCRWSPPPQHDNDNSPLEVLTVVDDADTKTSALIGYEADENQIVVAFRGTHNLRNWLLDLDVDQCVPNFVRPILATRNSQDDDLLPKVHCGFLAGYTVLRGGVLRTIQDVLTRHAGASLLVTGHSLGGAMANLAAIELSQLGNPAVSSLFESEIGEEIKAPSMTRLYTFGAPRTGDEDFAQLAHSHKGIAASYRVVHAKDPVPYLPFTSWEYHHIGSEVWYTDNIPADGADLGTKDLLSSPLTLKEDANPASAVLNRRGQQKSPGLLVKERLYRSSVSSDTIPSAEALHKLLSEEQRSSASTDLHISCDGTGEDQRCSSEVALWDTMLHAYDHLMYFGLREKC